MFISVDLPAPFSPRSAWTSPSRRSKLMSSFATIPGKRFVTCRISRTRDRSGIRGILFRTRTHRWPTRAAARQRRSAARNVDVAGADLLRDVVELLDQGCAVGRFGAHLPVADAAVRDVVERLAPAFERVLRHGLDRVEDRDVDLLRRARQDVWSEEGLVIVDADAPDMPLLRCLQRAEPTAARSREHGLGATSDLRERELL